MPRLIDGRGQADPVAQVVQSDCARYLHLLVFWSHRLTFLSAQPLGSHFVIVTIVPFPLAESIPNWSISRRDPGMPAPGATPAMAAPTSGIPMPSSVTVTFSPRRPPS